MARPGSRDDAPFEPGVRSRALQLFGLSGFAVAQPLLDVVARHPEILATRGVGAGEIVAVAAILLVAPPAALWVIVQLCALISHGLGLAVHRLVVAALAALTLLPPLLRQAWLPQDLAPVVAAAFLVLVFVGLRRTAVQTLASLSALAPPVFALVFVLHPPISRLLVGDAPASGVTADVDSITPVVLVVLDELPQTSLLDEASEIDALRYPAFARLAARSTRFRAATSIAQSTTVAVPAILTGRHPEGALRLPILRDHPQNLFTWLEDDYVLLVSERVTGLHGAPQDGAESAGARIAGLSSDLTLVYLHLTLPERLRVDLPPIDETWGGFWSASASESVGAEELNAGHGSARDKTLEFRHFVESLGPVWDRARGERGALFFLHSGLPHGPWIHLSTGERYAPAISYGARHGRWSAEPWWSIDASRRHLLQVGYTDRLLGELLDELERLDLFDPALVIVVADHGLSLRPGTLRRRLEGHPHPADVLAVPLFVKQPHQRAGDVSDRVAETIDILPTIADVLDSELPWPVDGCSLLRDDCPERTERRAWVLDESGQTRVPLELPAALGTDADAPRLSQLRHFGSGSRPLGLYRPEPYAGLAGRRVDPASVASSSIGEAELLSRPPSTSRAAVPGRVGARVVARLDLDEGALARAGARRPPWVAVAVDGVIETVVPAPPAAGSPALVAAMLPPSGVLRDGRTLALYVIGETPDGSRLHPVGIVP